MPFNVETLQNLRTRAANDLERTSGGDAQTPGTGYTEIANVLAGIAHGLYGNQQWIAEQILVLSADDDILLSRAASRGIYQIPAAFATGTAIATGNDGVVIPAGTVLQHSDGRQYRTTDEATIAGGAANVALIALEPGIDSHLNNDDLIFITPIADVDGDVASANINGGSDVEPVDRVRERLASDLQQPPLGGRDYDYVKWAKEAHVDVTRAWPFFHENGIGSVVVRFVTEDLPSAIPTTAHVSAVLDYIDDVRPAGMRNFTVEAPSVLPINIVFNKLEPNTSDVQVAIEAELRDLLRRESAPGGTIYLSHVREAISNATDEQDYVINLAADIVLADDQFAILGSITWPGQ